METLASSKGPTKEQQLLKPEIIPKSQVFDKGRSKGEKSTGSMPHSYPFLANFGSRANELYGLSNQAKQINMSFLYLNGSYELIPVQNKRSCLYAVVKRGIDTPADYTNAHLRRQLVLMLLQYPDFFYSLLKNSIMGIHGHSRMYPAELVQRRLVGSITSQEAADQRLPGTFRFHSNLQHMATPNIWGVEITLTLISMMWQVRITVVNSESLPQEKIHPNRSLDSTDLVVVFCGGAHYTGAGKHLFCCAQI